MGNKKITIGLAGFFDDRTEVGHHLFTGVNKAAKDFDVNIINFINFVKHSFTEDIDNCSYYKSMMKYFNKNNIDGLISRLSFLYSFMTNKEIEDFHIGLAPLPVVAMMYPLKGVKSVIFDTYYCINELMTHLINFHGYKKIAFIGGNSFIPYQDRFKSYKKILKLNNIPFNPDLVNFVDHVESRIQIKQCIEDFFINKKLKCKKDIEVIVTVSDRLSQILIEELSVAGINVPDDVAVTGYNNQYNSIISFPAITTVEQDFFNMGYQSVAALLSMIGGNKLPDKIVIPSKLVVRQSCGCFENSFIESNNSDRSKKNKMIKYFDAYISENYDKLLINLHENILKFDNSFNKDNTKILIDSLRKDLINRTWRNFLQAVNKLFHQNINSIDVKLIIWQNIISEIRKLILKLCMNEHKILNHAENIFSQARMMIDVASSKINFIRNENSSRESYILRIAAEIIAEDTVEKIIVSLRKHLKEFGFLSFYLALLDKPKNNISSSILIYANNKSDEIKINSSIVIPGNSVIPMELLPKTRQYSLIFNFLSYKGLYLGFILFEMDSPSISYYDSLRVILSTSLYRAIVSQKEENKNNEKKLLLYKLDLKKENDMNNDLMPIEFNSDDSNFYPNKIKEYLLNHLAEPTDLLKIAKDFSMSKISLMRKTKKMTGFTIQKMHEKLKIEKAKLLLENKTHSIAEISEELGYQSQFYFSKVFKKHTGMSPIKWSDLSR